MDSPLVRKLRSHRFGATTEAEHHQEEPVQPPLQKRSILDTRPSWASDQESTRGQQELQGPCSETLDVPVTPAPLLPTPKASELFSQRPPLCQKRLHLAEDGVHEQKHSINLILRGQSRLKGRKHRQEDGVALESWLRPRGAGLCNTPADARIRSLGKALRVWGAPWGGAHAS